MSLEIVVTPHCEVCKKPMSFADEIEILQTVDNITFASYVCSDICERRFFAHLNPVAIIMRARRVKQTPALH